MERLTENKIGNSYPLKDKSSSKTGLFTDYDGFYAYFEAVNRLGDIEDILGNDYDLELLRKLLDAYRGKRCFIMREPEDKGVSRLRELAFADLDGRCVVFPCSVGQKIYKVHLHDILELTVDRIGCGPSGEWHIYAHTDRANIMWKGFELGISQFGFTVFTNPADAVSALKESCIDKEGYHV